MTNDIETRTIIGWVVLLFGILVILVLLEGKKKINVYSCRAVAYPALMADLAIGFLLAKVTEDG
ncbi:MAG: hypothetical protein Q7V05_11475 [Methanoregula sp.]|nr:hypothetical protein [Methanoregula sp.]